MKKVLFGIGLLPMVLFANEGADVDIVQRVVNFVLFAFIVYYLVGDKFKAYFASRRAEIQKELDKVQEVLNQSKEDLNNAEKKVEEAKQIAIELIENAKKESPNLKESILENASEQIKYLEKSLEDKMEIESKKAKQEVISKVLDKLFDDGINLSTKDLSKIILKKVA